MALAAFALALAVAPSRAEVPVREIRVEGLRSIGREELIYLLCLRDAKTIEPERLRLGIKRAFRKGIFEYISVETDERAEGLVIVKVREKDVIRDVRFVGNEAANGRFLRRWLVFKKGEFMRYDRIDEAVRSLKEALGRNGYPDARVAIRTEAMKDPYSVRVIVELQEGKPLVVEKINVVGRPSDEVLPRLGLAEGDVYSQFLLQDGLDRLKKRYKGDGHFNPEVGPYTFSDGELFLSVQPGKRIETDFVGNEKISSRRLGRLLPFFEAEDVRDDLVDEAVQRIRSEYFAEGYPFVQIAPVLRSGPETETVTFYINEGEKVKVARIVFKGVTAADPEALEQIISLEKGEVYNPEAAAEDPARLKEFYASLGYLDAAVSEPKAEKTEDGMSESFEIIEGSKYTIEDIRLEGTEALPAEEVIKAIGVKAGDIYNEVDLNNSRYRIVDIYNEKGYAEASVEAESSFRDAKAVVTFRVSEGPLRRFGKHVITGNRTTKSRVIERELVHEEGSPFSQKVLMRERQNLYEIGLFSAVDTETLEGYEGSIDTVYRVSEARAGAVEFGLGYGEFEKERGFASVSYRNLFGMDREGSVRFEFSTLENRVILTYGEPWFMGRKIPFKVFLLREERDEKNIDTGKIRYRLERYTASAGVEKKLSEKIKGDFYYEFSLVKTFDVEPDVVLSREDVGTLAISAVRPALTFDTRDNPFDPTSGILAGASVKLAAGPLLSETDFVKLVLQGNTYRLISKHLVLAVSLRVGLAQGFASTDELPIVERFFLGGRNTVRGYEQDTLGPKSDTGDPLGGNAFAMGNFELRAALGKNLGLVGFVDTGNVWLKIDDMDLMDLKFTTGLGLRYKTPVGPVRVDYGYKLQREAGESSGELHFSIGHAF